MMAFPFAIVVSNLFFRDCLSVLGRSVLMANQFVLYNEDRIQYNNEYFDNLQQMQPVSNIFIYALNNCLDNTAIISALFQSFILLMSYSLDVVTNSNQEIYYMGFALLSFNIIISIALSFMLIPGDSVEKTTTYFTSQRIKMQLCLALILSLISILIIPPLFVINLKINSAGLTFLNDKVINYGKVVICLICGLFLQMFLLYFGQRQTSHQFNRTQQQAKYINLGVGMFLLMAEENTNSESIIYFVALGGVSAISFVLAGFVGFAILGFGLFITYVNLGIITNFSDIIQNAYLYLQNIKKILRNDEEYQKLDLAQQNLQENEILNFEFQSKELFDIQFAARNYFIFQQIILAAGQFILSTLIISLFALIVNHVETNEGDKNQGSFGGIYIIEPFCILGLVNGSALVYFINGTIQAMQRQITQKIIITDITNNLKDYDSLASPINFIKIKYQFIVKRVLFLISLLTVNILALGLLAGADCIIGFMIGFLIIGSNLIVENVLKSHSLRNSKQFIELHADDNTNNQSYNKLMQTSVQSNIYSYGAYNISGTAVLNFMMYCLLFCLLCVYIFKEDGYLKIWFKSDQFLSGIVEQIPAIDGNKANNQVTDSKAAKSGGKGTQKFF